MAVLSPSDSDPTQPARRTPKNAEPRRTLGYRVQPGALGRGGGLETFLECGMGNYVVGGSAKVGNRGVLQQAGGLRVMENSQAIAA